MLKELPSRPATVTTLTDKSTSPHEGAHDEKGIRSPVWVVQIVSPARPSALEQALRSGGSPPSTGRYPFDWQFGLSSFADERR